MGSAVALTITEPQELRKSGEGDHPIQLRPRPSPPGANLLWVSQSTQCEFPRMFRIDCKAIASLWLVSLDWTYKKTHKCKV